MVTLKIKQVTGQDTFPVEVELQDTVLELKERVAQHLEAEPSALKLIYRGQILKDGSTLDSYGGKWRRPPGGRMLCGRVADVRRHPRRIRILTHIDCSLLNPAGLQASRTITWCTW